MLPAVDSGGSRDGSGLRAGLAWPRPTRPCRPAKRTTRWPCSILFPRQAPARPRPITCECRVRYTLEQWNEAVSQCEQAVRLDGQNSDYHLWLGRALGEKADRASFLRAYSLAKRVQAEFEESVRLNPRNAEALEALGDYDVQAPGIVGGGVDKAAGDRRAVGQSGSGARPRTARPHCGRAARIMARRNASSSWPSRPQRIPPSSGRRWPAFIRRRQRWTEMESALHSVADRRAARQARIRCAL